MTKGSPTAGIDTRVSLVERAVETLAEDLQTQGREMQEQRRENRQNFTEVKNAIDAMQRALAAAPRPDYQRWLGTALSTVGIIAAIFALAEWRVNTATTPLLELSKQNLAITDQLRREISDLATSVAVEKALRARLAQ